MKVTLSLLAGFCPGVRRADETVNCLITQRQHGERIYTLGKLIHNRLYNDSLKEMGVLSIDFSDIENEYLKSPDLPFTLVI